MSKHQNKCRNTEINVETPAVCDTHFAFEMT